MDKLSSAVENLPPIMSLGHLVEEPDYIHEVHVVIKYNVSVVFDESKRYKVCEVFGGGVAGCPDPLPHPEHVLILQLPLEVQQEPAVGEVEVGVISVLMHMIEQFTIKDLYKTAHVSEVVVHEAAVREVHVHPDHEVLEATVC